MAWDVFKQSLGMDEPVKSNGFLFFSWDSGCQRDEKKCLHTLIRSIPKFF
jgi:hypothetical protein